MNVAIAIFTCVLVWLIYRAVDHYVDRSLSSFKKAEAMWPDLVADAQRLLALQISNDFANIVIGLVSTAGCGCYVRGMILNHYLPRLSVTYDDEAAHDVEASFEDIERAPPEQREAFSHLVSRVIVYDSFRNPLQGWLLRRAIKNVVRPEPPVSVRFESQITAISVLSRRSSSMEKFQLAIA